MGGREGAAAPGAGAGSATSQASGSSAGGRAGPGGAGEVEGASGQGGLSAETCRGSGGSARAEQVLDFVIPSDFAQSRVVQDRIIAAVEALQYSDNDLFAIKLALEEAMINAIKHGNRLDPTKTVTVHARVNPEQVEIIIEDQGAGFDRADVPDPTDPANLEKSSGRGILLIEAYMTKVEWSNQGRRLRMCKTREAQLAAG